MRYPVLTTKDASSYLASKRAGNPLDLDRLLKIRGDGKDLDQTFVGDLVADLAALKAKYPSDGMKSPKSANQFEGDAARAIHKRVKVSAEVLADADFWLWLAVAHFSDIVEWRYGNLVDGTGLANYGIGARSENLIYRLWLRADLVFDDAAVDSYHLCQCGQIDFYRSHLFRQGYANVRNFSRALLRFQYPKKDTTEPNLPVNQIRELVKRLRRLRTNLFLEVLDEKECRKVIEDEAVRITVAA
jgi:hypothetical protein